MLWRAIFRRLDVHVPSPVLNPARYDCDGVRRSGFGRTRTAVPSGTVEPTWWKLSPAPANVIAKPEEYTSWPTPSVTTFSSWVVENRENIWRGHSQGRDAALRSSNAASS